MSEDARQQRNAPHIDDEGLWLPQRFRGDHGLVIRTPRYTIDHPPGGDLGPWHGMVTERDFVEEHEHGLRNPDLAPNKVSLKIYGEDPEVFELDGVVAIPDGGQSRPRVAQGAYSSEFMSEDELPDGERIWWCDRCGAVFDRHHAERGMKFCNNCDSRDAVLNPLRAVGPGGEEVTA